MWCKICNRETEREKCELCGNKTEQDTPLEIYWCEDCKVPNIKYSSGIDKDICPSCKRITSYLCADLRPVFPEERLLLEILQDKPLAYLNKSVWASNNRYYIDGKSVIITVKFYKKLSPDTIREQLAKYSDRNDSDFFDKNIKRFVDLNKTRLNYIIDEARSFI